MEIALAKTELADVFLLKHGPEPVNIEARDSICAFRGIHFLEENCFVLGFERREWLIEKGCACFDELDSFLGVRNELRFLRWRFGRLPEQCRDFATDEWVINLVVAAYLNAPQAAARNFPDVQLAWYAERIEAARERIVKRFGDEHRLRPLARSVGMSTFQFARVFRELVGYAPHQYLLNVRYRAALHMLSEGASVTDACFQSGFSNLSQFTREFKTRFGQRPSSVKTWPRYLRTQRFTTSRVPEVRLRKPQAQPDCCSNVPAIR